LLGHAALLGAALGGWFALVYGGADALTGMHAYRVRVHLDFERAVPFVPAAVLGYLSIYPLFALAPFVLRSRRELWTLAATQAVVILGAGVCFVLLPVQPAFPPPRDPGLWSGPVAFARRVSLTYNFLPSLHVALSVVCVAVYGRRAGPGARVALRLWAAGIAVSTLLLHQHYLADVITGVVLAVAGVRAVYDRWTAAPRPAAANSSGQPVQESSAVGLTSPAFCPSARQRRS
jgi:hypothetical protein